MQIATVRFALCSLLMLVHGVTSPPTVLAAAAADTTAPQDRFCYSYIFRNYTAEDANDLHIGFEALSAMSISARIIRSSQLH